MLSLALLRTGTAADLALVHDLPTPACGDDEVLLRVAASALNRVDQVLIRGYPGLAYKFPHVLGADIAGEVAEIGKDVRGWTKGDRVSVYPLVSCGLCALCQEGRPNLCERFQYFGMHRPGGFAELVSVPARNLVRLSAGQDPALAAALGVSGVTAWHALSTNPDLRPGGTLLVWGATGGVGTLLIQLAKRRGLKVLATTRQRDQHPALLALGADQVLDSSDADLVEQVKAVCPAGVDQVVDYVGPATFARSFQMLKKGGTLTLCGILTGTETPFSIHQAYFRHLRVQGIYLGTMEEYRELLALAATGEIRVPIAARHSLATAREALQSFGQQPHVGKVVIDVSPS